MAIGPIPPVGAGPVPAGRPETVAPGFGDKLVRGLEQVSALEHEADRLTSAVAAGGPVRIHELMTATAKASLAVDLAVQVRNRAVEAYQEIMRLQV